MVRPSSQRNPILPPTRLGNCVNLELIGRGSMGTVYRGHHTRLKREVAVKVVDPRLGAEDAAMMQRFMREVRLLARVQDPHVVQIIEAGQEGSTTFAVMELVVGQSLRRVQDVQPRNRFHPATAAHYLAQIAQGLEAVHAQGIVHRDLKPSNVMIDREGRAKLADFGLARGKSSIPITAADQVVGSPEYMAPETILQEDVDGRADLYALGITGFELLTGNTPFHTGGVLRVVQDQIETAPPELRRLNPEVSVELAEVISRLLEKKACDRYANAGEAFRALHPFRLGAQVHFPVPELCLPGPVMPSWGDLCLIRCLVNQGGALEPLVQALLDWRLSRKARRGYVSYLRGHLEIQPGELDRAETAAWMGLVALRNRVGRQALKNSGGSVRSLAEGPPPSGVPLPVHLLRQGLLSEEEAVALDKVVNRSLQGAFQRELERVCQDEAIGSEVLIDELEATLDPERFGRLVGLVVVALVHQLS